MTDFSDLTNKAINSVSLMASMSDELQFVGTARQLKLIG
jgi:hypothetical protein